MCNEKIVKVFFVKFPPHDLPFRFDFSSIAAAGNDSAVVTWRQSVDVNGFVVVVVIVVSHGFAQKKNCLKLRNRRI